MLKKIDESNILNVLTQNKRLIFSEKKIQGFIEQKENYEGCQTKDHPKAIIK